MHGETVAGDAVLGVATGSGLAARLVGSARVEGPLAVTGAATVAALTAGGAVAAATLDVQGSASIDGTATLGALVLPQRSGVVVIPKGRRIATVSVPVGATSLALATLQRRVPGLRIEAAVPNAAKGRVTLHLNRKAPKAVRAAWLVVG